MTNTQRAYIGLGSNLEDPRQQVLDALQELRQIPQTRLINQSSIYRSDPVGPQDQPDYINAVACLETALAPEALLDQLQAIEQAHQRVRIQRWGPRTLDLDILLFGNQVINTQRLTVPHIEMPNRNFVLWPLAQIAPDLTLPCGTPLADWLNQCPMGTLEKLPL